METSIETVELFTALHKAQAEMSGAVKDANNPFFKNKYADLTAVIKAIKEPCSNNGLFYSQHPVVNDNCVGVETVVIHSTGQFMASKLLIPMSKLDPQGVGSCITYARRYALQSIFGIPAVDDDGQLAQFASAPRVTDKAPDSRIAEICEKVEQGNLQGAADIWYPMPKTDKVKLFKQLPDEVTEVMKGEEFVNLKGSTNGTA
jgi:hypothetical protein